MNWNLASARNLAFRTSRQHRYLHNHAVLSLLWHAEFRFRSFFNLPLFRRHTKLPGRKCARPCRGAAGAGHGHVPGGSVHVLAAGAGRGAAAEGGTLRPRPGGPGASWPPAGGACRGAEQRRAAGWWRSEGRAELAGSGGATAGGGREQRGDRAGTSASCPTMRQLPPAMIRPKCSNDASAAGCSLC